MGGDFTAKTQGIYGLAAHDVFKLLKSAKHRSKDLIVSSSFFEIYGGKVNKFFTAVFAINWIALDLSPRLLSAF